MSALLSRNGQILAMCCLIVGSVLPSVRTGYTVILNCYQISYTFVVNIQNELKLFYLYTQYVRFAHYIVGFNKTKCILSLTKI